MRLRLHGTKPECDRLIDLLTAMVSMLSVSASYPDRGQSRQVRVYLEIELPLV